MKNCNITYRNRFFKEIVGFNIVFSLLLIYLTLSASLNKIITLLLFAFMFKMLYEVIWISFGSFKWIFLKDSFVVEKQIFGIIVNRKNYSKPIAVKLLCNVESEFSIGVGYKYKPKYDTVIELILENSNKKVYFVPNTKMGKELSQNIMDLI